MASNATQYGDILRPPGTGAKAAVTQPEILASYAKFTQKGVTLGMGQGILTAGTVLGRNSTTKKYAVYASGASDGTQIPRGVLRQSVDTTFEDKLANIIYSGILKNSLLSGLDANAVTVLNGRQDTVADLFSF